MKQYYTETKFKNLKQEAKFSFDDIVFYKCTFENIESEGSDISSLFIDCTLTKVQWYSAWAHGVKFINCIFKDCDLRGDFHQSVFLKCTFEDCNTSEDSFGNPTEWNEAQAVDCKLIRTQLPIIDEPLEL